MTAAQLAALYQRRSEAVAREVRKTSLSIGQNALTTAKHLLVEQLYALDVDRTPSGRAKWKRTRALLNGETFDRSRLPTVVITNKVPYAVARHNAPDPPGNRNINPARVTHWRTEMTEIMRPVALEGWRLAIRDALEKS